MGSNDSGQYNANPRTVALRPVINLTEAQKDSVRKMRRAGQSPEQIALETKLPIDEVNKALLGLRTGIDNPTRMTINADMETYNYVLSRQKNDETMGETLRRLLLGE